MRVRVGQTITWSKPLVSALMVTRDRPALARLNVEAFLRQSWPWKELIVIDDSQERHQLPQDPRVKHVWYDGLVGMGLKHDLAVQHAQGDILAYWDDDDWFSDDRLKIQSRLIVDDRADVVGFKRDAILRLPAGDWFVFGKPTMKPKDWMGNGRRIAGIEFHDGTAAWSRHVMGTLKHPEWYVAQKLHFLTRLIEKGARMKGLPNDGHFVYVRHTRNTWQFREDLKLDPIKKPRWFDADLLAKYRSAARDVA